MTLLFPLNDLTLSAASSPPFKDGEKAQLRVNLELSA